MSFSTKSPITSINIIRAMNRSDDLPSTPKSQRKKKQLSLKKAMTKLKKPRVTSP